MLNKAIIGKKVGMTQIFNADGKVIPCTVIEAGPCVVTQLKTEEKDGYNAVQFGFEDVKEARLNKPQKGHLKKAGDSLKKYLKEFRFEDCTMFQLGDVVKADMFVEGDFVRYISFSVLLSSPLFSVSSHRRGSHWSAPIFRRRAVWNDSAVLQRIPL